MLVIILERVFLKFVFWNNFRFTEKLRKYYGELLLILYPDFINFEHLPHLLYHSLCPFTYIYMHTYMHIYFFILSHFWIGCLHHVPLHWIFSVYILRVRIFKSTVLILWFLNSAFLIITIFRTPCTHNFHDVCCNYSEYWVEEVIHAMNYDFHFTWIIIFFTCVEWITK